MDRNRRRWNMGLLSPPVKQEPKAKRVIKFWTPCDRCGYSTSDGSPIAQAKYKIKTGSGPIFLCGHHYRSHCHPILASGYAVVAEED
jgi:hypothetical protein